MEGLGMELADVNEGHVHVEEPAAEVDRLAILADACLSLAESTQRLTDAVAAILSAGEEE